MQTWTDDTFAASHNAQIDLQNMEYNFQTIKSLFSSNSPPPNTVAGMPWFDTASDLLYIRNAANASWYGMMHADASQQLWIYRNDAMSGWLVVTDIVDKVLAIKGGDDAYGVAGGQTSGTWTQPGHTLTESEMPSHGHSSSAGPSGDHSHGVVNWALTDPGHLGKITAVDASDVDEMVDFSVSSYRATDYSGPHTHNISVASTGGNYSHNHGSSYRPAAAVGTLQRMDI